MAKPLQVKTSVLFDGKAAINELNALKKSADLLGVSLNDARERLNGMTEGTKEFQDLSKFISSLEAQLGEMNQQIKKGQLQIRGYKSVLDDLSGASLRQLAAAKRQLSNMLRSATDPKDLARTKEALNVIELQTKTLKSGFSDAFKEATNGGVHTVEQLQNIKSLLIEEQKQVADTSGKWKTYQNIIDNIDKSIAEMTKVDSVLANLTGASDSSIKTAKDTLQELVKNSEQGSEALKKYQEQLAAVTAEEQKRIQLSAQSVLATPSDYSTAEIKDAIKTMELLRNQTQINTAEWHQFNNAIKNGEEFLQKWNDRLAMTAANKRQVNLPTISDQALAEQKKYWQEMVNGAEKGSAAIAKYKQFLSEVTAEEQRRISSEAGKVMGNLQGSSVAEIQEAIKVTEKLRDAQARGSQEYEIYNEEIKRATEYLKSYTELEKQFEMEDKWQNLTTLSANALSEQKKYWQEMVAGAGQGTTELVEYEAKLKGVVDEEQRRNQAQASKVMADPTAYSVREIEDAIKLTKDLQAAQQPGSTAWKTYGEQIDNARALLDKYNNALKQTAMTDKLSSLATASTASLAEQKKYWQEMVNGAEQGSTALVQYQSNLASVTAEEQKRIQLSAQQTIADVELGNWDKTIAESKEAVKQLQQYRDTLKDTDKVGLEQVDKAIADLNARIKGAQEGVLSMADALAKVDDLENFDGTIEDLEKLKKRLEEIRKTEINLGDADSEKQIKEIDDALKLLDKRIDEVKNSSFDLNEVLDKPYAASFNDLQRAASLLEKELKDCSEDVSDFNEKSMKLREVNARMKQLNEKWKEHDGTIKSTIKRLTSYVAVYGGFNFVWGKIKEAASANLSLSDSMADVQKTTAMTSKEIAELGKSIDSMDTRTSQQELYNLAATAGQLGIRGSENILGFVKASNQITVALNELGADGTSTLMKIANLTDDITKHGVENALLKIGSSINELTATTTATAGPMVDFIGRFGGVASAAGIATHEMAAVGATADALKQEIEVTGTAMNKVVNAVTNNTRNLAAAVNVDYKALNELVKSGKTMDAIVMVFEAMGNAGGASAEALKELGSEGDRMNRVITSFVGNIDMLRENLLTSATAFEQMTSIQNEYNVKNENAAALWERIQNTLMEIVTNPRFVGWLTDMLNSLKGLTDWLAKSEGAARLLVAIFGTFLGMKIVAFITSIGKSMHELRLIMLSTSRGFTLFVRELKVLGGAMTASAGVANTLKVAIGGLFKIIGKHPFLLVASAVAFLVTRLINFKDASQEAAEAQARLNEEHSKLLNTYEEERSKAEQLATKIKDLNIENDERKKLIAEFNRTYGKYLGYMLQEKATAEEVAAAYKLVNEALTNKHQLDVLNLRRGQENERFSQEQIGYINSLRTALSNLGVDDASISKAIAYINTLALQGKESAEIIGEVNKLLGTDFKLTEMSSWTPGAQGQVQVSYVTTDLGQALKEYTAGAKKYLDNVKSFTDEEQGIKDAAAKATFERQKEYLNKELERLKQMPGKDEEQLKEREAAYREYFNTLRGFYGKANEEQKKEFETVLSNLKTVMSDVDGLKDLAESFTFDAWGKVDNLADWTTFAETIQNLDKASPKSLAATLKAIEEQSQDMSEAGLKNFNEMFSTKFDTSNLEKFNNQVYNLAKQIRARLKELNRGTDANFLWGGDGSSTDELKRKAREEYKAALTALDAYYKEREALVRKQGAETGLLPTTIERNVKEVKDQWDKDKQELIKMLLGDASTFDPFANKGYMGVITENIFFGKNKNKQYLMTLASTLKQFGIAMEDGMRNSLSTTLVKESTRVEKEVKRMQQILLQDDFTEQVAQQYMQSLDKLGLLFGLNEKDLTDTTAEQGRIMLEAMREYADESYTLTATTLKDRMSENALFSEWMVDRGKESYEVLLGELRKFHDDQEEADRKAAERRKKIIENSDEGRALTQKNAANISAEEEDVEMWDRFKGMDLVTDDTVDRAQIDVYQAKIAASQAWIEQIEAQMAAEKAQLAQEMTNVQTQISLMKMRGEDTTNLEAQFSAMQSQYRSITNQQDLMTLQHKQEIADASQQIFDRQMSIEQRKVSEMKKYTDAIVDFSGQMGEAAFGEVEDRQEAGKQLIKSLLTTLKDWIQVKLTELAMQQLFAQQSTAISGQQVQQEMAMTGAKTSADIAAGTASATAKEAGSKGLLGLAVGAAIGAALSALLGLAMGALNKSKSQVASVSGATGGKLATGMLTYAEGNYPVLGNDGNVYNAKYEGRGMKTGVYGGGAHFGIFSEKQPEAIIDGKTTQKLMLNYPEIWKSIITLSRVGRIERGMGMRTFATGNIQEIATTAATADAAATAAQNEATLAMMNDVRSLMAANMALMNKLATDGVKAGIDMYGNGGMYKSMEKASKFAKRRGY